MTVELALTPDGRWDVDTPELIAAAGDAGFSAVGLQANRASADTRAACAAAGLRCHELLALVVSEDEAATLASARTMAEAAARVGAEWVLTVFRAGPGPSTADLIRRSAALFGEVGAKMAVEFSPLGPVGSIADGLEVVEIAGPERSGLMIDSWHFCSGGGEWEDLARVPLERIAYVQFADGLPPVSDNRMNETMDRRALPGDGVFDLGRFAATLLERGWAGTVSLEVLSRELRSRPIQEFARRAHDAGARLWR